mgnify:CR=1 FL=1
MKPSRIQEVLDQLLSNTWPVFICGPPGVGKASVVRRVAEQNGLPLLDIRASLLDPTDLRGIPSIQDGRAVWCPPEFLPREEQPPGILFFDELNAAPPLVQASLYQLTLDPGTPFHDRAARGALSLPDGDAAAALCDATHEVLDAAGMPAYEISNFARAGAQSRHNLAYWQGGDYIGIGPGAHGHVTGNAGTDSIYQIHQPERWLAAVEAKKHGTAKRQALTPDERAEEILMTGLRLTEGVNQDQFRALTGLELGDRLDPGGLEKMVEGGFLVSDDVGVRVTTTGRLCLNEVLRQLLVA